jgi:hypothetical protein
VRSLRCIILLTSQLAMHGELVIIWLIMLVAAGSSNIGGGAQLPMSTVHVNQDDLPLEDEVNIDALEYERIMRRICGTGDDHDIEVSAFNSSI